MKSKKKKSHKLRDTLVGVGFKNRNFLAVLAGYIFLFCITILLLGVSTFALPYLDQYYFGNVWQQLRNVQDLKGLEMKTLQNAIGLMGALGIVHGIVVSLTVLLFAFSGWLVLKIAKNKVWFLPALPVLIVAFPTMIEGKYGHFMQFGDPIKTYYIAICLAAALFGGWVYKHISVHK